MATNFRNFAESLSMSTLLNINKHRNPEMRLKFKPETGYAGGGLIFMNIRQAPLTTLQSHQNFGYPK
jgi:hypothetical protein